MSTGFRLPKKGILIGIQVRWLTEYLRVTIFYDVGYFCLVILMFVAFLGNVKSACDQVAHQAEIIPFL